MPFTEVNIKETIDKEKQSNSDFAKLWDESRTEYKLLAELVHLRKEQKITQEELAKITGNKQQVISRIEKRENSPTLKTFCRLLITLVLHPASNHSNSAVTMVTSWMQY